MRAYISESNNYTYGKKKFVVVNFVPELDDFEKNELKEKIEGKLFDIFSSYVSGVE